MYKENHCYHCTRPTNLHEIKDLFSNGLKYHQMIWGGGLLGLGMNVEFDISFVMSDV